MFGVEILYARTLEIRGRLDRKFQDLLMEAGEEQRKKWIDELQQSLSTESDPKPGLEGVCERLDKEFHELAGRIGKLAAFMGSPKSRELLAADYVLLAQQLGLMRAYLETLGEQRTRLNAQRAPGPQPR